MFLSAHIILMSDLMKLTYMICNYKLCAIIVKRFKFSSFLSRPKKILSTFIYFNRQKSQKNLKFQLSKNRY